jgi:hypothetical protein
VWDAWAIILVHRLHRLPQIELNKPIELDRIYRIKRILNLTAALRRSSGEGDQSGDLKKGWESGTPATGGQAGK